MPKLRRLPIIALCLLLPAAAHAQKVELTPFFGYRVGGDFVNEYGDAFTFNVDTEVDDGPSYGLSLGFEVARNLQLELFWSHQESELIEDSLFDEDFTFFDLDVDYYHIGILYQWTPGQVHPFVVFSIGATRFAPGPPGGGDESRFSVSLGGGFKLMFSDHVGIRFEGRGFSTLVDDDDEVFCQGTFCRGRYEDEYLVQGEFRTGLVFAF